MRSEPSICVAVRPENMRRNLRRSLRREIDRQAHPNKTVGGGKLDLEMRVKLSPRDRAEGALISSNACGGYGGIRHPPTTPSLLIQ